MGVLRFKVIRDLWFNRSRTLQVVLIIGIASASLGMILSTRNLVVAGMQYIWSRFSAPMIVMYVSPAVNEDDLIEIRHMKGVKDVEGMNNATIEWRVNPTDEWKSGGLTARADYNNMTMNKLQLVDGAWPHDNVMLLGQGDDTYFKIPKNGTLYLRYDDKVYEVKTGGTLYNAFQNPAYFGGTAQFYATQDEFEYIVGNKDYGQFLVRGDFPYTEDKAKELANTIRDRLEKDNRETYRGIADPNKHFFQDTIDGIFFLLGVLAVLALVMGLLLVYNTINSIISSQVDQIGVMKAVGGRTGQIVRMYMWLVMAYSLLALAVALPLTIWGGWALSSWLVSSFGADLGGFQVDRMAVIIMCAIAVLAPFLASLVPIWSASRTTVREAISSYGLKTNTGLMERMLARARRVSRLMIITVSNTFRHKGRVVLMQIAMVISGLVFMMVISVRDSVVFTVNDVIFSILNANVTMIFEDNQRIDYIENLTMKYPGVKAVEMWGLSSATARPRGQEATDDDETTQMMGVPLPTQVYGYQLRAGRWLNPDDQDAAVLNEKLAEDVKVGVGDWITVKYNNQNERNYEVVGLIFDPVLTNSAMVPRDPMLRDLGQVDRAPAVWIQTNQKGLEPEVAMAKGLRGYYAANHIKVSATRGIFGLGDSTTEAANTLISQFNFLIILLAIMAVVIGAVGSIALSGALALSVLERKREIGVMRAVGASSWTIFRMFIGEGLILGWMSWLIAFPLSLPAGKLMNQAMSQAFGLSFVYHYSPGGQIMWFVIVTILSIFASWLPARGATRISVRESLAYQ